MAPSPRRSPAPHRGFHSPLLALLLAAAVSPIAAQDVGSAERALELNAEAVERFKAGELEDAVATFRKAWALDPENATIKLNIARCYAHIAKGKYDRREFREAAADAALAEEFEPGNPAHGRLRGQALVEGGLYSEAADLLNAHLRRFPKDGGGWTQLGLAQYQLGEMEEAARAFRQALAIDPRDELARALLKKTDREEGAERDLDEDFGAPHFRIKFDGGADPALGRRVGTLLEAAYEEVGRSFGVYPEGETAVIVYPGKSFRQVTGVYGWVAALYDGKIRIPGRNVAELSDAELGRMLRHEFVHALAHRLAGAKCPVWLHEGLAQVIEGGDEAAAQKALRGGTPTLAELQGRFVDIKDPADVRRRYAASLVFTRWLATRGGGVWRFEEVLRGLGKGQDRDEVFKEAFGGGLAELYEEWSRAGR